MSMKMVNYHLKSSNSSHCSLLKLSPDSKLLTLKEKFIRYFQGMIKSKKAKMNMVLTGPQSGMPLLQSLLNFQKSNASGILDQTPHAKIFLL